MGSFGTMIPVLKYGYSCQLECAQTDGKLVSCGIYPKETLIIMFMEKKSTPSGHGHYS